MTELQKLIVFVRLPFSGKITFGELIFSRTGFEYQVVDESHHKELENIAHKYNNLRILFV